MPVGRFTLPAAMPPATSSIPMPRVASALGSSWMRTAYLAAPYTCTCATPLTVERRWAMKVSAYSSSADSDSRSEEHTSELQSRLHLVCRLLLEKKKQAL